MDHIKISIALMAVSVFLCPLTAVAGVWKELSGDHFIIYHVGNEEFAEKVLKNAESYYKDIAEDLGYPRYSEFWTWDKRAKIYIYQTHYYYIKATGMPERTHGVAEYEKRSISTYTWGEGFVESLLPHEIAHLIFRDFVGIKARVPLWMDEGVAQWAEKAKREDMKQMAVEYYTEGKFLLLKDLMKLDIDALDKYDDLVEMHLKPTITHDGKEAVLIITTDELINTYYLQGFSLIDFIIEKYGSHRFAELCRQLRDDKKLEDAIRFAYPTTMRDINELEYKWREYLAKGRERIKGHPGKEAVSPMKHTLRS